MASLGPVFPCPSWALIFSRWGWPCPKCLLAVETGKLPPYHTYPCLKLLREGKAKPDSLFLLYPTSAPSICEASQEERDADQTGNLPWTAVMLRLSEHGASWPLALSIEVGVKAIWVDHRPHRRLQTAIRQFSYPQLKPGYSTEGVLDLLGVRRGRSGQRY